MSGHSAGDAVEVCWPSAARLEFVIGFVEWRIAASASVDTSLRLVFVIFSSKGGFCAFLAEHTELFWRAC